MNGDHHHPKTELLPFSFSLLVKSEGNCALGSNALDRFAEVFAAFQVRAQLLTFTTHPDVACAQVSSNNRQRKKADKVQSGLLSGKFPALWPSMGSCDVAAPLHQNELVEVA